MYGRSRRHVRNRSRHLNGLNVLFLPLSAATNDAPRGTASDPPGADA
jgi:hypothetical protein